MNEQTELSINVATMLGFYNEILPIVGNEHCLLAINIISKFSYQGITETLNFNYGTHEYYSEVFDFLLREKIKVCSLDKHKDIYSIIRTEHDIKYSNLLSNALSFVITPNYSHEREVNIEEYISILNDIRFGRSCVCINHIIEEENPASVSIVLIFNRAISFEELVNTKYLLYKILITKVIRLINKKIRDKIKQQYQSEMAYLGHTIHNIFPSTFSKFKNVLTTKVAPTWEHYGLLSDLLKNFTTAHIIFQFASNQNPITQKNVVDILRLLKSQSTSIHSSELRIEVNDKNIGVIEERDDCESVFLLLWNLWFNAEKYTGLGNLTDKKRSIFVRVYNYDNKVAISFLNHGTSRLKAETKEFLMNMRDKPHDSDYTKGESSGNVIIKRKADDLSWKIFIYDDNKPLLEEVKTGNLTEECELFSTQIILITNVPIS